MSDETLESQIRELTDIHMNLVSSDHHKDRDCHWTICKTWSYGDAPKYHVEHAGYIYTGVEDGWEACNYKSTEYKYDTYAQAAKDLISHLQIAIRELKSDHVSPH